MAHNIEHIIEQKIARLESVPDQFVAQSRKIQLQVYKEISKLLGELDKVEGRFALTQKNINLIERINASLKKVIFNEDYIEAITTFAREFSRQAKITEAYFAEALGEFTTKELYKSVLSRTQKNALALLTEDAYTQVLINPVTNILESSVISEVSYKETIQSLENFILGAEGVEGKLISHVKRVAYDSFAVSDRTYTNVIAEDLGLEFYRYQGGKIDDTRDFCKQRDGKYFHKKEIQAWVNQKWQGKNTATTEATIFAFAGGYNCKHSILPVSTKSVPKSVIQRNIENGNYTPD